MLNDADIEKLGRLFEIKLLNGLKPIKESIEHLELRLDKIEVRIEHLEASMRHFEKRHDQLEKRVSKIDKNIVELRIELNGIFFYFVSKFADSSQEN